MIRTLFRISSYLKKEFLELFRQPRLIFGLILAPFLILLLVGLGYQDEPREYRTLFVVPEGTRARKFLSGVAENLNAQLNFQGFAEDLDQAQEQLINNETDLVIAVEDNPRQQIAAGERVWLIFYHQTVDPRWAEYMPVFSQAVVEEVNQRVITRIIRQEQYESQSLNETLEIAVSSTELLKEALREADLTTAAAEKDRLEETLSLLDALLLTVQPLEQEGEDGGVGEQERLTTLIERVEGLAVDEPGADRQAQLQEVEEIQTELQNYQSLLERFQTLSPELLVSPFRGGATNLVDVEPNLRDYFVGPVIALMLQHLAVTFAALSYVRDRQLGVTELVRVAPLKPFELMLGKFISHFLTSGAIAAVLGVLAVTLLKTPMQGGGWSFGLITAALLLLSTGMGFVISLLSETDSQAVQYAMILLLASVFFSGFFLPLESLWWPVRSLSWLLPSTYGIMMYRDLMLRGVSPDLLPMAALLGMGLTYFLLTLILLRRFLQPAEEI